MKRIATNRVKATIWAAIATFLAAIALTAAGLIWQTRQAALQEAQTRVVRVVGTAAASLNRSLLGVDVLLASMEPLLGLPARSKNTTNRAAANQMMGDAVQQNLLVRYVALIDTQANVIASSRPADTPSALLLPEGFIKTVLSGPVSSLAISAPALNTASAEGVVYLARYFRLPDGSRVLAVAELQLGMLTTVMVQGADISGMELTLERTNGQLVASIPRLENRLNPPTQMALDMDTTPAPLAVQRLPARLSGVPALVAAQPLLYREFGVSASLALDAALNRWRVERNVIAGIALVFTALTLLMGSAAFWYVRRMAQSRRAMERAKNSLDQALESMASGFLLLNKAGDVVTWNRRYGELFPWVLDILKPGLPFRAVLERSAQQDMPDASETERLAWVELRQAQQLDPGSNDRELSSGITVRITERRTPDGGLVIVYEDVTALRTATAEIEQLAFYDPLTRLPNRRLLGDRLARALTASARSGEQGALLFLDLDNFKTLNDTLGHDMGDRLLERVAQRLTTCVREQDTVARLGGDEFVVMLEGLGKTTAEATARARLVGNKILASLNQPYRLGSHLHNSTPSVGAALFGDGEKDAAKEAVDLLKQADIAMYQVKASGRNGLCFFDSTMQVTVTDRASLESDLRTALVLDQFELYYQGQYGLNDLIVGAEVLIRWNHPARGLVGPAHFIGRAEETALIVPIGHWVLSTACKQLKRWETVPQRAHLALAVNVSARQFRQADFVTQVKDVLRDTGANPERLKIELTETVVLANVADTVEKMKALKALGVRFAMDDFGTGQSSLTYLTQLPLDQLKIDQSFVRNIGVKEADAVIIDTIIGMAFSLGLQVLAEGVETQAQRDFLMGHGCPLCQGYLFGKPAPLAEFEATLNTPHAPPID